MKINKQLFEDVLSGKLKGTFVLRNGITVNGNKLIRTGGSYQAYAFWGMSYIYDCNGATPILGCSLVKFIPDTDMKQNELTIEIPDGKIVDWDESKKQNKIVLKDKQLTYEDICEKLLSEKSYFITNESTIHPTFEKNQIFASNCAFTQHQLVCILAKNKLANVAKYLNDGWKPSKGDHVFTITYYGNFKNKPIITEHYFGTGENLVLFQTPKDAIQAIEILGEETIKLALEPLGI